MKVVVLGDIGQRVYHVGDDAMTHAAVDELAARGISDIILLTRNVSDTVRRFERNAAPTVEFPWPYRDTHHYQQDIRSYLAGQAHGLSDDDQIRPLINTIRGCDAVLVAGGGNLNSLFGWLLHERAAVTEIAWQLGKPVVIAGQTIGPMLYGADRGVAARMLSQAALVGAREGSSLRLGRDLTGDATVVACLDDASFLGRADQDSAGGPGGQEPESGSPADVVAEPYIAATFSGGTGACGRERYIRAVADALDGAAALTGLKVLLLPHMSVEGEGGLDEAMHSDIAAAMTSEVQSRPIASARSTAVLTAGAELVITSRYHPVVFALDGGIPVVALSPDDYSDARLRGAMDNWGVGDFALTLPSLLDGGFTSAIDEAWQRRAGYTAHLRSARPQKQAESAHWWDAVVRGLHGDAPAAKAPEVPGEFPAAGEWVAPSVAARELFLPMSAELAELRKAQEHLHGEADAARAELTGWFDSRSFRLVRKLASARTRLRPGRAT